MWLPVRAVSWEHCLLKKLTTYLPRDIGLTEAELVRRVKNTNTSFTSKYTSRNPIWRHFHKRSGRETSQFLFPNQIVMYSVQWLSGRRTVCLPLSMQSWSHWATFLWPLLCTIPDLKNFVLFSDQWTSMNRERARARLLYLPLSEEIREVTV